MSLSKLKELYGYRFSQDAIHEKSLIWKVLCINFFQKFIPYDSVVLDIATGHGDFINNIIARKRIAIDFNPNAKIFLDSDIEFHQSNASDLTNLPDSSVDIAFSSNFFEHLSSKNELDLVMEEILRVLKPSGLYIILQPNIRYEYKRYWDYYDHILPLSHLSCAEGLVKSGFLIDKIIPKFLPFTTKSKYPKNPWIVALYLKVPFLWMIFGKQFFILARKK